MLLWKNIQNIKNEIKNYHSYFFLVFLIILGDKQTNGTTNRCHQILVYILMTLKKYENICSKQLFCQGVVVVWELNCKLTLRDDSAVTQKQTKCFFSSL